MSCKSPLDEDKENPGTFQMNHKPKTPEGSGTRSRLPVSCSIGKKKRGRGAENEDDPPEACPPTKLQKREEEGSLMPPPSIGPVRAATTAKKRGLTTQRSAVTLRTASRAAAHQRFSVDAQAKAKTTTAVRFSVGSRLAPGVKTSNVGSRVTGNQNARNGKPAPLNNATNTIQERQADKGNIVHPTFKKRPAWDTKGRLEDMEAYLRGLPDINELQKKLESLTSENVQLETRSESYCSKTSELESALATERMQRQQSESMKNMYESELRQTRDELSKVRVELQKCQDELISCRKKFEEQEEKIKRLEGENHRLLMQNSAQDETITDLKGQLLIEESKRRDMHEQLQEMKGNIRVFCRVRPFIEGEIPEDEDRFSISHISVPNNKSLNITTEAGTLTGTKAAKFNSFQFDQVFGPRSSQADIFEELSQLVQSALDGFNVCIFAYGQTGSGKTFTMEGDTSNVESLGVIPRSVKYIFHECDRLRSKGWSYTMQASYLEIYNEKIQDLLTPNRNSTVKYELRQSDNEIFVTNLTKEDIQEEEHLLRLMKRAQKNRAVAETECNEYSSRSHSVFMLKLTGVNTALNKTCSGILNLVDLAGSERAKNSGAEGTRFTELKNINSSLTSLSNCIMALGNKSSKSSLHVPFRNSKLTHLLQNCLGGNCKTLMFINVSPIQQHAQESLNSLRFAEKVSTTKIGPAAKNF